MKCNFLFCFVWLVNGFASQVFGQGPSLVRVHVIDPSSKSEMDGGRWSQIEGLFKTCSTCEIKNTTTYTASGLFDLSGVPTTLEKLETAPQILVINWNQKSAKTSAVEVSLRVQLQKLIDSRVLVITSGGHAGQSDSSAPLVNTALGSLRNSLIIGEIEDRERLVEKSFFGPEMLTALKIPDSTQKGLAPFLFAAPLAGQFSRRKPEAWIQFFQEKQLKRKKIWLETGDFFYK